MSSNFRRVRLTRIALSLLAMIPVLWTLAYFQSNYSGLCRSEQRILSDQEIIKIAKKRTLSGRPREAPGIPARLQDDCCEVSFTGYKGIPITFWQRITGFGRAYVSVSFIATIFDQNGKPREVVQTAHWRFTNCGYATIKP